MYCARRGEGRGIWRWSALEEGKGRYRNMLIEVARRVYGTEMCRLLSPEDRKGQEHTNGVRQKRERDRKMLRECNRKKEGTEICLAQKKRRGDGKTLLDCAKKQEGAGIYRRTVLEDRKGAEYIERGRHQKKIK